MATLLVNNSQAVAGLGTSSCTVLSAMSVKVDVQSTLPAGSALQTLIKLNSTTKLTIGGISTNPTPTQPTIGGSIVIACAANDVINVVLSSANAVDAVPNAVKSIITLIQD